SVEAPMMSSFARPLDHGFFAGFRRSRWPELPRILPDTPMPSSLFDEAPSRRDVLRSAAAIAASSAMGCPGVALAQSDSAIATNAIPHSGERLPVIGLGTANEFQRQRQGDDRARLKQVVVDLLGQGCKLIDTASSYGQAEAVLGDLLSDQDRSKVFLATKIE